MPISELELADLKARTANAIRTNSSMANVEGHIEALKAMIGKSGVSKVKTADTHAKYLYQLILQAETLGAEVPVKAPEPPPVVKAPVVEAPVIEAPVVEDPIVEAHEEDVVETPAAEEAPVKGTDQPEKHSKSKKDKKKS